MSPLPRILMVSSEASPWAKSGGLADVLGALPAALAGVGHAVATVIPRYMDAAKASSHKVWERLSIALRWKQFTVDIWQLEAPGPLVYFVDCPELFDRPGLYGADGRDYLDNHLRFAVLCRAAIEINRRLFRADIIHSHDWQASLVPAFLKNPGVADPSMLGVKSLLTIHNMGYQGIFHPGALEEVGLPRAMLSVDGFEFNGDMNMLKGGIEFADAITTVSQRYAEEIQTPEYGFRLDGLLRRKASILSGIVNGVDYGRWNPETDPLIPAHYSADDLAGKQECKRELLEKMGLPERALDRPVIGIISRFTSQKGFDLIAEAADELFEEDFYLVALGNGEERYEDLFRALQEQYPDKVAVKFGYDDPLAHQIEAGADLFLMPSRYEPCGLNQIYSLRYGTVPVVRSTGGLEDTIHNAPPDEATGYKFSAYNGKALLEAVREALGAWENPAAWRSMMVRGMRKDFSWTASAEEYSRLYRKLHPSGR